MGLLQDGQWVDEWYETKTSGGEFKRQDSQFRNWVTTDGSVEPTGSAGFKAEAGRYHLYVSLACPWAHRALVFRQLKGLQDLTGVTVVKPLMLSNGWELNDNQDGLDYMYQLYLRADSDNEGRVTTPLLWDKQTQSIVIILDGRGGGTGAAPLLFRNHISVPTLPALARARHYLDRQGANHVTLIITGGLRVAPDFVKALCLGADGIALANSAMQAIGCAGARMCHTNNCPVGVATQKPELRARLKVQEGAERLQRYFESSVELMKVLARGCGNDHLNQFNKNDITSWKKEIAELTGSEYAGFDSNR